MKKRTEEIDAQSEIQTPKPMRSRQDAAPTDSALRNPQSAIDKVPILVVDNRPENILQVERILRDMDIKIVTAASGRAALKACLEHDFALILLDVMMPGMDGFEIAALIRGRERSYGTPIIFLTAVSTADEHVRMGYSLGAVDYIFLPCPPEILQAKVRAILNIYRTNQPWRSSSRRSDI